MADVNIKQDQNLERSILGCLLQDGSLINNESVAKLKPSDFMYEHERIVFNSMKELETAEEPIDSTTVINRLKENNKLEKVGGAYYITGLPFDVTSTAYLPTYAEKLISNTKHNGIMRIFEDVRTGKADPSKLEKLTDAERGQDYDMSDTGNAQLLAKLHSDNMRFNNTSKEWLVWNGQYWGKDRKLQRYNFAEDVSQYRQKQAMSIKDNTERMKMFSFGVRSGDKVKIDSMLAVASTLPEFATTTDDWDQD